MLRFYSYTPLDSATQEAALADGTATETEGDMSSHFKSERKKRKMSGIISQSAKKERYGVRKKKSVKDAARLCSKLSDIVSSGGASLSA